MSESILPTAAKLLLLGNREYLGWLFVFLEGDLSEPADSGLLEGE